MKTRERNHVDSELAKIRVQETGELEDKANQFRLDGKSGNDATHSEAGGDTGHDGRYKSVKVTVSRRGELESSEADIV